MPKPSAELLERIADWHGDHACKAYSEFLRWDNKHDVTADQALSTFVRHASIADALRDRRARLMRAA